MFDNAKMTLRFIKNDLLAAALIVLLAAGIRVYLTEYQLGSEYADW